MLNGGGFRSSLSDGHSILVAHLNLGYSPISGALYGFYIVQHRRDLLLLTPRI